MIHILENNYISQVLPQKGEFWAPLQAPQPENLASRGGAPEHLALKTHRAWSQVLHKTRGKRNSTPEGHTQGLMCTGTQGKTQWLHCILGQTYLLVDLGGSPRETGKWGWLTVGTRTLVERYWGGTGELTDMSSPGGCHCDTKTWPHPVAYKLQFWDTSGQTAKRVRTQPHPSTDRMPKLFLSSQPHLNKPFDMTLPTRGTRSIFTH